jgi:chloramphenicol-sensitive protein RarD
MPVGRWLGFALIWLALVVFTADALRRARRNSQKASQTFQKSVRPPGTRDS